MEEPLTDITFNVHKFNDRPKPENKKRILIVGCLSEFGCETIGCMFCLPRILQERPGDYKIAVGWYGREYFYRHLVDEFWEIKEEHQWLREYCRAFHNESKNLTKLENSLQNFGRFVRSQDVGRVCVGNRCKACNYFWGDTNYVEKCPECENADLIRSLFGDIKSYRDELLPIPKPASEKMELADKYIKPNSVGIFARGRKCYGRNLQPDFYIKLIELLEALGYSPIWLGEKQSTQPCQVDRILDFSRLPEARDLELTTAIVSKLKFTIQFWTASTRIAAIANTPHLLFESPGQIWGNGQEGQRLSLLKNLAPCKLVICHYLNVFNDNLNAIRLAEKAIYQMNKNDYKDIVGMVEDKAASNSFRKGNKKRIGDD
jgi:predicted Zn-ribbon and HTH transcriptional regulator